MIANSFTIAQEHTYQTPMSSDSTVAEFPQETLALMAEHADKQAIQEAEKVALKEALERQTRALEKQKRALEDAGAGKAGGEVCSP